MTSEERREARYQRRKAAREAKRRELMERYDDFERAASPIALMVAHFESRRGVLWKYSPAKYDRDYMKNAVKSSERLHSGQNVCQGFYSFKIIERGKLREIHSVHYTERVIRRSFCINCLVPLLSHNLIYDNGASLKDKGIDFAIRRTATHLHRFYRKYGDNDGYVIVVDFRKYFHNIRLDLLADMVDRYIHDPRLNAVTKQFFYAADRSKPPGDRGRGLFIGPEDSQILAISFPNPIDHAIKDQMGQRYYERYNDDSVILCRRKEDARRILDTLLEFYDRMGIIPNPKKTQIVKLSRGFTFLKTKFFLEDTGRVVMLPCRETIVRQRRKIKKFRRFMDRNAMSQEQVNQSYMSWRGFIEKKKSGKSVRNMDVLFLKLFHEKPWKKKSKSKQEDCKNGREEHGNPGRDQRAEAASHEHRLQGDQAL